MAYGTPHTWEALPHSLPDAAGCCCVLPEKHPPPGRRRTGSGSYFLSVRMGAFPPGSGVISSGFLSVDCGKIKGN